MGIATGKPGSALPGVPRSCVLFHVHARNPTVPAPALDLSKANVHLDSHPQLRPGGSELWLPHVRLWVESHQCAVHAQTVWSVFTGAYSIPTSALYVDLTSFLLF